MRVNIFMCEWIILWILSIMSAHFSVRVGELDLWLCKAFEVKNTIELVSIIHILQSRVHSSNINFIRNGSQINAAKYSIFIRIDSVNYLHSQFYTSMNCILLRDAVSFFFICFLWIFAVIFWVCAKWNIIFSN